MPQRLQAKYLGLKERNQKVMKALFKG